MKSVFSVLLVPMVLLIFFGTAMAKDDTEAEQVVSSDQMKNDEASTARIKTLAKVDKHAYVQCFPRHRRPMYCTPVLSYFCDELCGDVSPSRCGGSRHWGKQCRPGLKKKCNRCGFLE